MARMTACCTLRSVMLERMAGGPWMDAEPCHLYGGLAARAWRRVSWYPLQEDRRDEGSFVLFGIGDDERWRVERMSEDPERWEVEIRSGSASRLCAGRDLEQTIADAMMVDRVNQRR